MNRYTLWTVALTVGVIAATRRAEATRGVVIPSDIGGFWSFLPFID